MRMTATGLPVGDTLIRNYFHSLVNRFFKILPIRENEDESLPTYIRSLQVELIGCREFVDDLRADALYLSLLAILQYFIDNPDSSVPEVKREVFRAISICNKLEQTYADGGTE